MASRVLGPRETCFHRTSSTNLVFVPSRKQRPPAYLGRSLAEIAKAREEDVQWL